MSGSLADWAEKVRDDFGKLTPGNMVVAARRDGPETCPVWESFHFDDDETMAERARLEVARQMIKSLRVVYRPAKKGTPERAVRAYHAVPDDEGPEPYRYEPAEVVAADPVLRELVLRDMEREWKLLKSRYGHMVEFVALVQRDIGGEAAA